MYKKTNESYTTSSSTFEVPEFLEGLKSTLFHEAGHLATARALGVRVWGYSVGGKVVWISSEMPPQVRALYERQARRLEGFVSVNPEDVTEQNRKLLAAGGAAGELILLGYIESGAKEQAQDRFIGGISTFGELQEIADVIADRLETGEWSDIFVDTLDRMSRGQPL